MINYFYSICKRVFEGNHTSKYLTVRMFFLISLFLGSSLISIITIPFNLGRGNIVISFISMIFILAFHSIMPGYKYQKNIKTMSKENAIYIFLLFMFLTIFFIWLSFVFLNKYHER